MHLGEAVEVLHKLPEGRQLVRAVRGRIGGAKIISINKNIFSPGYKKYLSPYSGVKESVPNFSRYFFLYLFIISLPYFLKYQSFSGSGSEEFGFS